MRACSSKPSAQAFALMSGLFMLIPRAWPVHGTTATCRKTPRWLLGLSLLAGASRSSHAHLARRPKMRGLVVPGSLRWPRHWSDESGKCVLNFKVTCKSPIPVAVLLGAFVCSSREQARAMMLCTVHTEHQPDRLEDHGQVEEEPRTL